MLADGEQQRDLPGDGELGHGVVVPVGERGLRFRAQD
jgi:hypothetical protein